jgi:tetratricopeptide (TPR) repeat protein
MCTSQRSLTSKASEVPKMATLAGDDKVHQLDTSIVKRAPTELPKLSRLVEKGDGGEYVSRLRVIAEEGKAGTAGSIAVGALPVVFKDILGPAEEHLRNARRLIEQEQYAEALRHLDQALAEAPNHPDAIYMTALCLSSLGQPLEALRALAALRGQSLEPGRQTRVGVLREQIRRQAVQMAALDQIGLIFGHQSDQEIERLRTLCELDPEMAMFHYMLAGALLTAGRLEEAATAASEGLRSCREGVAGDDGVQRLHDIKREIRRRLLLKQMEPARRQYRKGKFAKARSELLRLGPDSREDPLWTTFDGYVQELEERGVRFGRRNGGAPATVTPHGSFEDVDALHFLLVGDEIGTAKAQLAGGRPDRAERAVDDAIKYAPTFPYAHFLKAHCLYDRLGRQLESGKLPGVEEAIAQLEEAREHAQFGLQDPDLQDNNLLQVIDAGLEAMRAVQQELRLVAEDAELLNPVVESFHSLMASAKKGIESPEHFEQIDKRLKKLEDRVAKLKSQMKSETGAGTVAEFEKVLAANRRALEQIRPELDDVKLVQALQNEFMSIMSSAAGGVSSYELPGIRRRLEKLAKAIAASTPTAKTAAGTKALLDLAQAVKRNIDEAARLM